MIYNILFKFFIRKHDFSLQKTHLARSSISFISSGVSLLRPFIAFSLNARSQNVVIILIWSASVFAWG